MTETEYAAHVRYMKSARTMTEAECAEVERKRSLRNGVRPAGVTTKAAAYGAAMH